MSAPFTDPLRVRPVTAQVRELGRLTTILLRDGPLTAEEQAYVARCEAEAESSDPFYGMMERM
jgi:hypothetical protein